MYEVDEVSRTIGLLDDGTYCWGMHDIDVSGCLDDLGKSGVGNIGRRCAIVGGAFVLIIIEMEDKLLVMNLFVLVVGSCRLQVHAPKEIPVEYHQGKQEADGKQIVVCDERSH